MKSRLIVLGVVGVAIAALAVGAHLVIQSGVGDTEKLLQGTVVLNDVTIPVDIAATEEARHQGLSGRQSLSPNTGMWFIFPYADRYAFWMPDMHFAIDIIWFNDALEVVHIKENATPESYPEKFTPDTPARYVLEVPVGFVAANKVVLGDTALFNAPE